jgi:hypothetical protein
MSNVSRLEASAVSLVTVLGVASGLTQAHAGSGFVLRSQSTTLLGSAQAGMITESDNASLIVDNPASLGWGNGREAVFGGTPIFTAAHFRDRVADTLLGTPISGGDGGNNGTKTFLPNLYAATDVAPAFRVGLGVTSLYGLSSTWQPGWLGRYYSISSQLVTYDILPTLSYRPNQSLSVGIAPIVQFARAKSTTAIDFGTIDQITLGGLGGGRPGLTMAVSAHGLPSGRPVYKSVPFSRRCPVPASAPPIAHRSAGICKGPRSIRRADQSAMLLPPPPARSRRATSASTSACPRRRRLACHSRSEMR